MLIEERKKQPLVIPLIKSLNKEANVLKVIKGDSDGSDLNGREQHILEQVNKVDDRILRTLINFYSPTHYEEAAEISKTESAIQRISEEQQIAQDMFDQIMQMKLGSTKEREKVKSAIKDLFNKQENKDRLFTYLDMIDYQIDLNRYPYTIIKTVYNELFKEIQDRRKSKIGYGFVKFLSSDPRELINKLNILIAETRAGNNNVFDEISAIVDELRRLGHLTIGQIKKIYKMIA